MTFARTASTAFWRVTNCLGAIAGGVSAVCALGVEEAAGVPPAAVASDSVCAWADAGVPAAVLACVAAEPGPGVLVIVAVATFVSLSGLALDEACVPGASGLAAGAWRESPPCVLERGSPPDAPLWSEPLSSGAPCVEASSGLGWVGGPCSAATPGELAGAAAAAAGALDVSVGEGVVAPAVAGASAAEVVCAVA